MISLKGCLDVSKMLSSTTKAEKIALWRREEVREEVFDAIDSFLLSIPFAILLCIIIFVFGAFCYRVYDWASVQPWWKVAQPCWMQPWWRAFVKNGQK